MADKVILITGCSSGIGFELIRPLLERGFLVYASLRKLDERRNLFESLAADFPKTLFLLELDVANSADRARAIRTIELEQGGLDVLVNNAGFGVFGPLEEAGDEDVREQFETNFFGPLFLTRSALPLLRWRQGRIITISSVLGSIGLPFTSLYCSSKFALEGLFESLAHELAPLGVKTALVLPGGHKTRFFENRKRLLRADSPYATDAENLLRMMSAGNGNLRGSPQAVVTRVLNLIEGKRMPLRTFVGLDAKAIHCLHSLLPQFIFQPLIRAGVRISARR